MRQASTIAILLAMLITLLSVPAHAYVYIKYDEVYTGYTPDTDTPWLTALFEDPGEDLSGYSFDDGVLLTLTAHNIGELGFVSNWYFNFALDYQDLNFQYLSSEISDSNVAPSSVTGDSDNGKYVLEGVSASKKLFNAGAGLKFELNLSYETSNSNPDSEFGGRFVDEMVSQILITSTEGITAEDFNEAIEKHGEEFLSVAHIQGLGDSGSESAWVKGNDPVLPSTGGPVPAPEPSSILLLLAGLAGMLGFRFYRKDR